MQQCTIHQVENGEYVYTVTIDGVVEHSVKNSDPEEFSDVSVYASDPWNLHQPSHIRALTIQTIMVMESFLYFYVFFVAGLETRMGDVQIYDVNTSWAHLRCITLQCE